MASVRQLTTPNREGKKPWVVEYTDPAGKRRRATPKSGLKKDADKLRQKIEREIADGVHTAPSETALVRDVCEEYLREAEDRLADGRIGQNRYISLRTAFNCSIIPRLGNVSIAELTADRVGAFYRAMRREDGLAVRTSKDRVYSLSLLEEFARRRGYTKGRPVKQALIELRGTAHVPVRTFTADEVSSLLATAETKGRKLKARSAAMVRCLVHLAAFCGLRFGEIMALSRETVDIQGRVIRVRHSLLYNDVLKGPKTRAGLRDVPLPAHVAEMIRHWLAEHYVENPRALIFRTPKATIISNMNFHRQWKDLLTRAGLAHETDGFHFHALRHFCASWMIENGMSVMDVAALLGHSKFDMTLQVYAHPVRRPHARHDTVEEMVRRMPPVAITMQAPSARQERDIRP